MYMYGITLFHCWTLFLLFEQQGCRYFQYSTSEMLMATPSFFIIPSNEQSNYLNTIFLRNHGLIQQQGPTSMKRSFIFIVNTCTKSVQIKAAYCMICMNGHTNFQQFFQSYTDLKIYLLSDYRYLVKDNQNFSTWAFFLHKSLIKEDV